MFECRRIHGFILLFNMGENSGRQDSSLICEGSDLMSIDIFVVWLFN